MFVAGIVALAAPVLMFEPLALRLAATNRFTLASFILRVSATIAVLAVLLAITIESAVFRGKVDNMLSTSSLLLCMLEVSLLPIALFWAWWAGRDA